MVKPCFCCGTAPYSYPAIPGTPDCVVCGLRVPHDDVGFTPISVTRNCTKTEGHILVCSPCWVLRRRRWLYVKLRR